MINGLTKLLGGATLCGSIIALSGCETYTTSTYHPRPVVIHTQPQRIQRPPQVHHYSIPAPVRVYHAPSPRQTRHSINIGHQPRFTPSVPRQHYTPRQHIRNIQYPQRPSFNQIRPNHAHPRPLHQIQRPSHPTSSQHRSQRPPQRNNRR